MMKSFSDLEELNVCPGLNAYMSPCITSEYETQIYVGCVCQITYHCIMSTDESGEVETYSPIKKEIPRILFENHQSQNTVIFDVEDWDVESSPLEDGAHEQTLAELLSKNARFSPKKKTSRSVFHECDSFSQSDTPDEVTVTTTKTNKKEGKKYTLHKGNPRKLHVRNINFRTTQKKLWTFFTQYGEVEFCHLYKDNRGKSKGRGCVCFRDEATAASVLQLNSNTLILDKRTLFLESFVHKKYETEEKTCDQNKAKEGCSVTDKSSFPPSKSQSRVTRSEDPQSRVTRSEDQHSMSQNCVLTPEEPDLVNSLPDELLLHLFSFLTLKQRFLCERVCKRWREISFRAWKSLETLKLRELTTRFGGLNDRQFRRLLKRGCPVLKMIDLSTSSRSLTDGALDAIGHYCPSVRGLDLSGMTITNKGLGILAEKQLALQRVHLRNCYEVGEKGLWWLFHRCKDLKELSLDNNKRVTGQCFHVLGNNVLKLSLTGCSKLQDLALDKIRLRSRELLTLNLDDCMAITDLGVQHVSQIKTLRVLYLCGLGHNVTSVGMESLSALPNLEELYVPSNASVTDSVLCALGRRCKQLRVLNITSCHCEVTDVGVSGLAGCTNLEILKMSYIHKVEEGLTSVARDCPLRELVARGCGGLTNDALCSVADFGHLLQKVDLSGCDQFTNRVLDRFIEAVSGETTRQLMLTLGGTNIHCDVNSLPTNLHVDMDDLCIYNLRPDQDISLYLGASDDSEEDANDLEDYFGGEAAADLYDYLVAEDRLLEEELELS